MRFLGLDERRDAMIVVPSTYRPEKPAPFALMLHGASNGPRLGLRPFAPHAEREGMILLAPHSREYSWDAVVGGYGPDVESIDRALAKVFTEFNVDPNHLGVAGFSDGASYALSIGLINGDLFTHVMAFSPGFVVPGERRGEPEVFIAHGVEDNVLPIESTSREIVPRLENEGYDVEYIEHEGRHEARPEEAALAVRWFLG